QTAFRADDLGGVGRFGFHAAHKVGGDIPAKLEAATQRQVHAGLLVEMRVGLDAVRLGIAEEAGKIYAVAADVHQRATAGVAPVAWIIAAPSSGSSMGADVQDAADFARNDTAF